MVKLFQAKANLLISKFSGWGCVHERYRYKRRGDQVIKYGNASESIRLLCATPLFSQLAFILVTMGACGGCSTLPYVLCTDIAIKVK